MEIQDKKLSEGELKNINAIKDRYSLLQNKLGNIEISINNLKIQKKNIFEGLKQLRETESVHTKQLVEKYGTGNINLQTGEIS